MNRAELGAKVEDRAHDVVDERVAHRGVRDENVGSSDDRHRAWYAWIGTGRDVRGKE
jgi:hypothetical protein